MANLGKGTLFSVEHAFTGRDKIQAPLKMPALEGSSKGPSPTHSTRPPKEAGCSVDEQEVVFWFLSH